MSLARKLSIALVLGILVVHGISAVVRVRRELQLFEIDATRDARALSRTLSHSVERAWLLEGEPGIDALLVHANEREGHLSARWTWVDGRVEDPSVPPVEPALLEAMRRGESVTVRSGTDPDEFHTFTPIVLPDAGLGTIEVIDPLVDERAYLVRTVLNTGISTLTLVALCAVLAWGLGAALVGRPVQALVEQARRIGAGNLGTRLHMDRADEIGDLAREMDRMCDGLDQALLRAQIETSARMEAMEQLRHADRLATVGTLASGVAHELGTPINVVDGHAQLIQETAEADVEVVAHVDVIRRQCARMAGIVRQLLDFSRRGGTTNGGADAVAVARELVEMVQPLARRHGAVVTVEREVEAITVKLDAASLQQVLLNILVNAIQAMPSGGEIGIGIARSMRSAAGKDQVLACITITDSGPGMKPDVLEKIFEPFFTTKEVGAGTGLGLSVVHGLVSDAGGWIDVESDPGAGTRFAVYLPGEAHG